METALMFNALGLAVGTRFLAKSSVKADQRSFYLYNVGHNYLPYQILLTSAFS